MNQRTYRIWLLLKITYGLLFVIAGVDKFFNFVVNWEKYVNPTLLDILPINMFTLMTIVAVIEITLGLLVLTKYTQLGAYGMSAWFLIIIVNLLTMLKYFDIAVRDLVLAIGAYALAQLTTVKEETAE
jgi:uncharacterized membrane protein YphA (DoxX/SURF4 family)